MFSKSVLLLLLFYTLCVNLGVGSANNFTTFVANTDNNGITTLNSTTQTPTTPKPTTQTPTTQTPTTPKPTTQTPTTQTPTTPKPTTSKPTTQTPTTQTPTTPKPTTSKPTTQTPTTQTPTTPKPTTQTPTTQTPTTQTPTTPKPTTQTPTTQTPTTQTPTTPKPTTQTPTTPKPTETSPVVTTPTPTTITESVSTQNTSNSTTGPTTAPTTPIVPTLPPTPDDPPHPWNVSSKTGVCIFAEFAATVRVQYNNNTIGFNIPSDAVVDEQNSSCNSSETQILVLNFNDPNSTMGSIALVFNKSKDAVFVESVRLSFKFTEQLFPNYIHPEDYNKTVNVGNNTLSLFSVSDSKSYKCDSQIRATLGNDTNFELYETEVDFIKAQIQAWEASNSKDFSEAYVCDADKKVTDVTPLVPIIVGSALGGLVLIVLVVFFIGRRRNRRNNTYSSM